MDKNLIVKYWQQSKFDDDFNELSFNDNNGTCFEYIDPVKRTLKYYKNHDLDISQELLDNIKNIKSDDHKEKLLLKYFLNLIIEINYDYSNRPLISFRNTKEDKIIGEYAFKNNEFRYYYNIPWGTFGSLFDFDFNKLDSILNIIFKKYLGLKNANIF